MFECTAFLEMKQLASLFEHRTFLVFEKEILEMRFSNGDLLGFFVFTCLSNKCSIMRPFGISNLV